MLATAAAQTITKLAFHLCDTYFHELLVVKLSLIYLCFPTIYFFLYIIFISIHYKKKIWRKKSGAEENNSERAFHSFYLHIKHLNRKKSRNYSDAKNYKFNSSTRTNSLGHDDGFFQKVSTHFKSINQLSKLSTRNSTMNSIPLYKSILFLVVLVSILLVTLQGTSWVNQIVKTWMLINHLLVEEAFEMKFFFTFWKLLHVSRMNNSLSKKTLFISRTSIYYHISVFRLTWVFHF